MNHRVEIFQASNREWFWHIKAGNNKIIQTSGEGYKTKWGAKRAVKKNLKIDESKEAVVYPLLALVLAALIWALATRTTTTVVQASQGTQPVTQQPKPSPAVTPQQPTGDYLDQPTGTTPGK